MFDTILENLEDYAGKFGLPADQLKSLTESLKSKLADGDFDVASLMATAQEHGLSVDKLQTMLGSVGGEGMLGKIGDLMGNSGGENSLGGLADMAKGFFGKE
ncbi:MAG: hypothetical protein AB7U35_03515 [Sphingobium sp.]